MLAFATPTPMNAFNTSRETPSMRVSMSRTGEDCSLTFVPLREEPITREEARRLVISLAYLSTEANYFGAMDRTRAYQQPYYNFTDQTIPETIDFLLNHPSLDGLDRGALLEDYTNRTRYQICSYPAEELEKIVTAIQTRFARVDPKGFLFPEHHGQIIDRFAARLQT